MSVRSARRETPSRASFSRKPAAVDFVRMERYTRIILFLAATLGACLGHPSQRIINGEPIAIQQFPSAAAVLQQDGAAAGLRCGAAVLTSFYVLTAASCVKALAELGNRVSCLAGRPANYWPIFNLATVAVQSNSNISTDNLKVRTGSATWSEGGRLIDVITTTIHPDFEDEGVDLALLGLAQPIFFNDTSVGQAPMPFQDMEPMVGMTAFVVGWGATEPSGEPSQHLQFGLLSITGRAQCAEAFSSSAPSKIVTENHICASGAADLCSGDAGSPLYSAGLLVGVASYFPNCGELELPSVYTHVARYLKWIQKNASGVPEG
ncbi:Trypsin, alkaline C [Eumeta japonica]|uniref:Trypsin, alkaline C n=1 Tax=Eumeta variegata TaxID=151549 RepID=A0A4C1SCV0_EUMVA|nr:Trypsin, alkaline C [Eumeta japonica]